MSFSSSFHEMIFKRFEKEGHSVLYFLHANRATFIVIRNWTRWRHMRCLWDVYISYPPQLPLSIKFLFLSIRIIENNRDVFEFFSFLSPLFKSSNHANMFFSPSKRSNYFGNIHISARFLSNIFAPLDAPARDLSRSCTCTVNNGQGKSHVRSPWWSSYINFALDFDSPSTLCLSSFIFLN